MRIYIAEDNQVVADRLKLTINRTLDTVEVDIELDHDRAKQILLRPHHYDVVVLDIFRGNLENEDKVGQEIWREILREKFMPVIIYTAAECEIDPPFPNDNPILKCFHKEQGTDEKIARHLQSIRPHILALRETRQELNTAIQKVLWDTSKIIWQSETDDEQRKELLYRSVRRRLAATMDLETEFSHQKLLFWEQYIYPPLEIGLLMGDLLLAKDKDKNEPTAYRLVLTPSCDLVLGTGRRCVSEVLVAKCQGVDAYLKAARVTIGNTLTPKTKEQLSKSLNDAHCGGYIFLPEYKSIFPAMTACLRDLALIPINEIVSPDEPSRKFERVVSIDSPFREQISWAYLQIGARPGMPDRDAERCVRESFTPS
jgi:hypothetical protein